MMSGSEKTTCLALYDFDSTLVDTKLWYESVLEWAKPFGYLPTRMGISGEGIRSTKTLSFKGGDKKLRDRDFKGLDSIGIYFNPENHTCDSTDFVFSFTLDLAVRKPMADFGFDSDLVPLGSEKFKDFCHMVLPLIKPAYGIGYERSDLMGPTYYAYGVIGGMSGGPEPSEEESERITKWLHGYKNFKDYQYHIGLLREVYPSNFITTPHLEKNAFGLSLKEWIQKDPSHGTLCPFDGDVWLWQVPSADVEKLNQLLKSTGILFCV
jgi:hypothetical protein